MFTAIYALIVQINVLYCINQRVFRVFLDLFIFDKKERLQYIYHLLCRRKERTNLRIIADNPLNVLSHVSVNVDNKI